MAEGIVAKTAFAATEGALSPLTELASWLSPQIGDESLQLYSMPEMLAKYSTMVASLALINVYRDSLPDPLYAYVWDALVVLAGISKVNRAYANE